MIPGSSPGPAPGGLRSLEVVLTAECNLRCSYCYQNRRPPGRIAWPTLRGALDLLLESRHPAPRLSLLGGEPLLARDELRQALEYLEDHRDGRRVDVRTSTNGTLFDDDAISLLARHDVDTQVSCDGLPAAQERRAPGTSATVEAAVRRLADRQPDFFRRRVTVSITLGSHNLRDLAASFDHLLDLGVRRIAVAPLVTHDPGWSAGMIGILAEQAAAVVASSLAVVRRGGEMPLELLRPPDDPDPPPPRPPGAMCRAGAADRLTVDVDGRLAGCVLLARSYQRFPEGPLGRRLAGLDPGRLEQPDLAGRLAAHARALRATRLFDGRERKHSSYGSCADCPQRDRCTVCPVSVAHLPGNTDPDRLPDLPCAFNLVFGACVARFDQ